MTRLARWLRGALGIGLTWAGLWVIVGLLLWTVIRVFRPDDIDRGEGLSVVLPIFGIVGLLSGLGFAALLSLAERRRQLGELSLGRVAVWGLLGSAAIPLLLGAEPGEGWLTGVVGATFATASVAIARRGANRFQELSDAASPSIKAPDGPAQPRRQADQLGA